MMITFFAACAVLAVVPILFVVNDVYEDGVIGRMGLLGVSFVSTTYLLEGIAEWVEGNGIVQVHPQTVAMAIAFAVFLCWHLFRFHRRVLRGRT